MVTKSKLIDARKSADRSAERLNKLAKYHTKIKSYVSAINEIVNIYQTKADLSDAEKQKKYEAAKCQVYTLRSEINEIRDELSNSCVDIDLEDKISADDLADITPEFLEALEVLYAQRKLKHIKKIESDFDKYTNLVEKYFSE